VRFSRGDASVLEDALLLRAKELTLIEPDLDEAPFEEFCGDVMIGNVAPSIGQTDSICFELLDPTPISFPLLPTTPSHLHPFHESLGDIRGYYLCFDPYYTYLEDMPRTIMQSHFFDCVFYFSMVFDEFKRPLTLFASLF